MKLNIGSGRKRLEGYTNIDMNPKLNPDLVCNLASEGWPISDGIVTEGVCSHVMEHLPNTPEPFFHFLRELYRVCANGAVIHVAVPHPRNDLFFRDPTHVRPILPDMLVPFSKRQHAEEWARGNMLHPWHEEIGVNFDVGNPYYILDEDGGALVACYALVARGLRNASGLHNAADNLRRSDGTEAAWWMGLMTGGKRVRAMRALRILIEAVK